MAGMSLENQFMAKDHSAEILELQQKAPQEGRGFLLRFPPFQLFLKGSKEEYTIISKHATDVQQRVQQGVVFTAALLVWDFPVLLLLQILSKGLALHKNLSWQVEVPKYKFAKVLLLHWVGWSWADSQHYQVLSELQVNSRPYLVVLHLCNTTSFFATIKILKCHKNQFSMFPGKEDFQNISWKVSLQPDGSLLTSTQCGLEINLWQ